jgi:UDP-N-acetylglucosamine 3-dehydrogenase
MPSRRLRVAVIGAGNMGKNHLRNYFLLPDAELVGLADVNPATKALAKEHKAAHYTDYRALLEELKPDAISVVVPTSFHFEVASFAMERGIHVLLEKPIASTVDEADKLITLANKQKVVFTVGHIERFNPLVRKLKHMLDEKKVGEVSSVICKRVGGFPPVEPKTDVIIDLAVHDIDIISHLLGKQPKRIHSHGSRTHHSSKIDSAEILMDYGDASGFVQANWLTPVKIRTVAVTGSEGYIEGNYITQELEYYRHNLQKEVDSFSNFVIKMGEPEKESIKVDFEEPLALELKAFLACVQGSKTTHLVEPFAAREALRLAIDATNAFEE